MRLTARTPFQFMSSHQGLSFLEERGPIPADAESMATMAARALDFWQDQIVPLARSGEGGVVGVVSHGAFCKSCCLLRWPFHPPLAGSEGGSLIVLTFGPRSSVLCIACPSVQ